MAKPAASQAYTPTFAQLEPTQGKSAPTKPATAKPAPAQAYTPTFAQLTSGGSESSGPKAVAKKQPASPYAPTFAQVSTKRFCACEYCSHQVRHLRGFPLRPLKRQVLW